MMKEKESDCPDNIKMSQWNSLSSMDSFLRAASIGAHIILISTSLSSTKSGYMYRTWTIRFIEDVRST